MNYKIMQGEAKHLPEVLDLVHELAAFEEAADQVKATLSHYQEAFGQGNFQTIIAAAGDKVIGMALYYLTWSTWRGRMLYLEDLVVSQPYRGAGVGQALLDAFINRAKELDCNIVKWQVLDWNTPAIKFYEKQGATIEKEWWNVKIIF